MKIAKIQDKISKGARVRLFGRNTEWMRVVSVGKNGWFEAVPQSADTDVESRLNSVVSFRRGDVRELVG